MSIAHGNMRQMSLFPLDLTPVVKAFAESSSGERGAIFTRREVVEFILDLAGYTTDRSLHKYRLLEPSFGDADFLLPIVNRLLISYKANISDHVNIVKDLTHAIRCVEVNIDSISHTRIVLTDLLKTHGVSTENSQRLLDDWIISGDFLLADLPFTFTHAIGNPPYVRQDLVPDALMAEYRARYSTIYDRADLYVPFIERCLTNLETGGVLGFICADRWMKNKYGGPLRAMVARDFHLACYVDMVDTPAFDSDVIAYPSITIIKREKPGPTRIAQRPEIDSENLSKLALALNAKAISKNGHVVEIANAVKDSEPWVLQSFDKLALVRRLEKTYSLLEDVGCKVGIGVATGADKVYIESFETLDVEPDRKLPLVKTKDIEGGSVKWNGLGVINPFRDDGSLVNLAKYPKLRTYFKKYEDVILKRNCAKKNPKGWYRTIDRIYPELTSRPKLLIPDIKGEAHIVYEDGHFYPHHNLYFITSGEWDLRALQAVLQSGIAKLFVSIYSTQMRGGYLRFQAQYLRRIRIPQWKEVPNNIRKDLIEAAKERDMDACSRATFDLYQLTPKERTAIADNNN